LSFDGQTVKFISMETPITLAGQPRGNFISTWLKQLH